MKTEADTAPLKTEPQNDVVAPEPATAATGQDFNIKTDFDDGNHHLGGTGGAMQGVDHVTGGYGGTGAVSHAEDRDRPIQIKDDG